MSKLSDNIDGLVKSAKAASKELGVISAEQRTQALRSISQEIGKSLDDFLQANKQDVERAQNNGLRRVLVERLKVPAPRYGRAVDLVNEIADRPDIVGTMETPTTAPNGLQVSRMRMPLGVVCMIYEARPTVTADAAACCLRSGNAAILRGGSEARLSNGVIADAIARGLRAAGLPEKAVQVVPWTDREAVKLLLGRNDCIDVVIPRGGETFIQYVKETSKVPVLAHSKGVCHVFVHAGADLDMGLQICADSKSNRPFTCHAAEAFLIDRAIAPAFVPKLLSRMKEMGVEVRGDAEFQALGGAQVVAANDSDWGKEHLDMIVSARVVDGVDGATSHIAEHGSDHTETIVTEDEQAAEAFFKRVYSSTLFWNASTRLSELPDLGLGPELGTSTSKLHVYGPMGAEDLTTTKFVIRGQGQLKGF